MQLEEINESIINSANQGNNLNSIGDKNDISNLSVILVKETDLYEYQNNEKGLIQEEEFLTNIKVESRFLISEQETKKSKFVINNSNNQFEYNENKNLNFTKKEYENNNDNNYNYNNIKNYGNTFPLLFNKDGEPMIVIGPHCKIKHN